MKRVTNLLSIIVLMIASACNSEQVTLSEYPSFTCRIQSRNGNLFSSLPTGSQILLNAQGGLVIDNRIFIYDGNIWVNENNNHWTLPQEETHITALYPIYPNNDYTQSNLYSTGELEDVLVAQKTYSKKENITLQFNHLFSSLTINIEETLLESIREFLLTIPVKVNHIFPQEGTFSIIKETHIITKENHGEKTYSFIIPPSEACVLTLTFIMKDNTIHKHELNPHTFLSGNQYVCNVVQLDSCPGIRTAEDLISFSQLINGTYKGNKTLADFGHQVDGETIYYLLNDIELTEEDCERLEPIGAHTSTPFVNTFDGKGHTISNLKFKAYNGYGGLFGKTDSSSIIKNLNLDNCLGVMKVGDNSSGMGIIAGRCNGTISNCHVTNSTLSNDDSFYTGGISGYTSGRIINSSVKSTILEASIGSLGIVTGYLYEGYVMNSYSCNNTVNNKTTHNGGICGYAQSSTITNCYTYANQNVKGHVVGTGKTNTTVTYCYCDQGPVVYSYNKSDCNIDLNYKYHEDFTATSNNIPVYQLLNQWIESQETNQSSYIHWKGDSILPALFLNQ